MGSGGQAEARIAAAAAERGWDGGADCSTAGEWGRDVWIEAPMGDPYLQAARDRSVHDRVPSFSFFGAGMNCWTGAGAGAVSTDQLIVLTLK